LVLGLPLCSYPLSWVPRTWIYFRFNLVLPIAEIVFATGLFCLALDPLLDPVLKKSNQTGPIRFFQDPVLLPLLAVALSALLSTRFSARSYLGLALLPRLAGDFTIFLLAARLAREGRSNLRRYWVIAAFIVAANGLIRIGSEPEFISTFGNRNFLAAYLAASAVLGISIGRKWSIAGSFLLLGSMWFCHSRGAWLALGIVFAIWFLGFGGKILRSGLVRAALVLIVVATAMLIGRHYILRQWQSDVRPMIWQATLRMIAARPVVGHGLGTYETEYPKYRLPEYFRRPKATNVTDHAHDELLEIAAEQGLIGLTATLWLWAAALGCGLCSYRRAGPSDRPAILGLIGATGLLMLHSLIDIDLRYPPNRDLFWLLLGLLAGADSPRLAVPGQTVIRSTLVRLLASVACLGLGCWVLVVGVANPLRADWLDRKARIAEGYGDSQIAIQCASQALRLEPFRLSTQYLLAGALSKLPSAEGHQAAIEECLRIEEMAPDYADVTFNLGQLYLADGRAPKALPYLRHAVQIDPYDAGRRMALAAALRGTGKTEEARQQLEQALQLQPANQNVRDMLRQMHKKRL